MLTATKQAKTGYWIEPLKLSVYSLEEINYFIYNHINLVYRDFFSDELFDYIGNELEQQEMAAELRNIAASGGNTGDFIKHILNGSYYYNGRELADISMLVAHIDTMSRAERVKIQCDAYYNAGNFNSALQCCFDILRNMETDNAGKTFYARIAYTAGRIYAKMFMVKSANAYFSMAYDLSPDPLYARASVYMSIIAGDDEELLSAIVRYRISDDELESMRRRVTATRGELERTDETAAFKEKYSDDAKARELAEQWKKDYYKMIK